MSNIDQTRADVQKMENHYLKVDLLHFFAVVIVLVLIIAGLAIWDAKTNILAGFTQNLLSFLKLQF